MVIFIKLGKAYFEEGYFFNIKKAYDDLIGKHDSSIHIQLGKNSKVEFEGKINRTANPNSTPRIMVGVSYRKWVQANFKLGETMKVEIVAPNSIILYAKGEEH